MNKNRWMQGLICVAAIAALLPGQVRAQEEAPPTSDGASTAFEEPPAPSPNEPNAMNGTAPIISFDFKLNANGVGTTFAPATLGKPLKVQVTQQDVNEALDNLETFYNLMGMTSSAGALHRTRNGQLTATETNTINARSKVALTIAAASKRVGGCLWNTEITRSWWLLGRNEHLTSSWVLGTGARCPIDYMGNTVSGSKNGRSAYGSSYGFQNASNTYSRYNPGIGPGLASSKSLFRGLKTRWAPTIVASYSV